MIPANTLPLRVTWSEPGETTDEYGNTIADWYDSTDVDDVAAWISQEDVQELRDGRDTLVSAWVLITNELGITAHARILWDDRVFELVGEPSIEHTPAGPHHLEARMSLVEG